MRPASTVLTPKHTEESLLAHNRAALEKRLGVQLPAHTIDSHGVYAGLATLAVVWILFSVAQGIRYLFGRLLQEDVRLVVVGLVGVTAMGLLGLLLFRRAPRAFGCIQLFAAVALGAYFGHRMSGANANWLEQMANLVGAVFLFVDGAGRMTQNRRNVRAVV